MVLNNEYTIFIPDRLLKEYDKISGNRTLRSVFQDEFILYLEEKLEDILEQEDVISEEVYDDKK